MRRVTLPSGSIVVQTRVTIRSLFMQEAFAAAAYVDGMSPHKLATKLVEDALLARMEDDPQFKEFAHAQFEAAYQEHQEAIAAEHDALEARSRFTVIDGSA